ncbi:hypothetical protein [Pseudomonas sp. 6D_7.1_Bac1]|uniref:hypothetical protein n=1 Tax=Pseudomonas sp. 6D_7.1_Bac1 TaxID=2971615 RepID=UPI0021C69C0C|nr:hypothetical protein [Pseudomonas sp. 6D_7.1_Bac1]MCU1750475.1 hypothetical protein [Pseudomonas sp. 6D_7.1_Bac1]
MNHWSRHSPPFAQQLSYALLGAWIVAWSEFGVVNAFLLIDKDKRCVSLKFHGEFSLAQVIEFSTLEHQFLLQASHRERQSPENSAVPCGEGACSRWTA